MHGDTEVCPPLISAAAAPPPGRARPTRPAACWSLVSLSASAWAWVLVWAIHDVPTMSSILVRLSRSDFNTRGYLFARTARQTTASRPATTGGCIPMLKLFMIGNQNQISLSQCDLSFPWSFHGQPNTTRGQLRLSRRRRTAWKTRVSGGIWAHPRCAPARAGQSD